MHDHAWRVAGRGIDLFQGRKALLGELRPGPAADYLHPVRRRRAACLLANPPHALGERWHAIPAHFVGIGQSAAYEVGVRVVQPWYHGSAPSVDDPGSLVPERVQLGLGTDADDGVALDRNGCGVGLPRIERRDTAVHDQHIGGTALHERHAAAERGPGPDCARTAEKIPTAGRPLSSSLLESPPAP